MTVDHADHSRLERARRCEDMTQQRFAGERCQDLRQLRAHTLALSGGQDHYIERHRVIIAHGKCRLLCRKSHRNVASQCLLLRGTRYKSCLRATVKNIVGGLCPLVLDHVINFASVELGAEIFAEIFDRTHISNHVTDTASMARCERTADGGAHPRWEVNSRTRIRTIRI